MLVKISDEVKQRKVEIEQNIRAHYDNKCAICKTNAANFIAPTLNSKTEHLRLRNKDLLNSELDYEHTDNNVLICYTCEHKMRGKLRTKMEVLIEYQERKYNEFLEWLYTNTDKWDDQTAISNIDTKTAQIYGQISSAVRRNVIGTFDRRFRRMMMLLLDVDLHNEEQPNINLHKKLISAADVENIYVCAMREIDFYKNSASYAGIFKGDKPQIRNPAQPIFKVEGPCEIKHVGNKYVNAEWSVWDATLLRNRHVCAKHKDYLENLEYRSIKLDEAGR